MGPIALRPWRSASQKVARVAPGAAMTPMPVTATRRVIVERSSSLANHRVWQIVGLGRSSIWQFIGFGRSSGSKGHQVWQVFGAYTSLMSGFFRGDQLLHALHHPG